MELQDVMQEGWAKHDSHTAEVADLLEGNYALVVDDTGASGFLNLVNHTIGDHLGDRKRALQLCETVVDRLGDEPGSDPLIYLAVARHLAGRTEAAAAAEGQAGADLGGRIRVRMLVAQGYMHAGEWARATTLYNEALAASDAAPEGHGGERAVAVVSNNIAGEILALEERTAEQAALMEKTAQAARTYWLRIGDWTNDMRSDYLSSLVETAVGRPVEGRAAAEHGLATIAANEPMPVDEAFLHLARAKACRDAGNAEEQAASIQKAEALAQDFEGDGLIDGFQQELAKAR